MAKRKKRRSTRSRTKQEFPGWLWMLFGLAIGLSVAFAVYMRDVFIIIASDHVGNGFHSADVGEKHIAKSFTI